MTHKISLLLRSIMLVALFVLQTACHDNPAVYPTKKPYLQAEPTGKPSYPGKQGQPIYPDKVIYYPDGVRYYPKDHTYEGTF